MLSAATKKENRHGTELAGPCPKLISPFHRIKASGQVTSLLVGPERSEDGTATVGKATDLLACSERRGLEIRAVSAHYSVDLSPGSTSVVFVWEVTNRFVPY
ncbi:hypothetical protein RRG08_013452 [Elysia crispata]|uniref:Uncharacterized protein n=1 Tax=Elysia crispata TaxID=231223 RepID=A0AAE1B9F4_9GAST|nr:hypothetical protein RRG08_013452 [Elysia crispata]